MLQGMCTRATRRGRVPHAGDTCRMVGTLPPHPGNMQKLSRVCATCLGWCMSQSRVQDAFCAQNASDASGACSTHWGRVLDGGHAAPTSWEHAEAVPGVCHTPGTASTCSQDVGAACPPSGTCTHALRRVINYFTWLIYVL